jgi:hypothetical protein
MLIICDLLDIGCLKDIGSLSKPHLLLIFNYF